MRYSLWLLLLAVPPLAEAAERVPSANAAPAPLRLEPTTIPGTGVQGLHGTYAVFEDRESRSGRRLLLDVAVLPATGPDPHPEPLFVLAGGPGQAATSLARGLHDSWLRERWDIVLVDQRGTGGDHALRCELPGSPGDPQGYLEPVFRPEVFRECLGALRERADLRRYTTPFAMDDLDEIRRALGYRRINLMGGSYGSRAALVYMRRHPEIVRAAVLRGVAPIAFRNPLPHARAAQDALERTFAACEADEACRSSFPDFRRELESVLGRLDEAPAEVRLPRAGGPPSTVRLTREGFAGALRVMMYYAGSAPNVPRAIHDANGGDYLPFARLGVAVQQAIRSRLAFGMLLSVTCAEDLARIDPSEIEAATRGTFLGDGRVRRQMEICEFWPRGSVPDDFGEPVRVDVPTLLLSGTLDPVTPPEWAAGAAAHLKNGLHVVAPGYHDLGGPCIDSIVRQFLERGSAARIDTSCVQKMSLPPFHGARTGPDARRTVVM